MNITLNGNEENVPNNITVARLLEYEGIKNKGIAVMHNDKVVNKDKWEKRRIHSGDKIEIIKIIGGGSGSDDSLYLGSKKFDSRLIIGTGKYSDQALIPEVIDASGTEMVTVAVRRVELNDKNEQNLVEMVGSNCIFLSNTSGARTAEEAVQIARLAHAAGCGKWVKVEVIPDQKYLLPDNHATLIATETLVEEGFTVLPYMSPDLITARQLHEAGAAAVMPLGAPIGSNRGLRTKELIRIMIDEIDAPIIVDAGIGKPSEAAEAMEMGADAVLINTAIATADDPVVMARAFSMAVKAGRQAYKIGTSPVKEKASASSPLTGFLFGSETNDKED